MFLQNLVYHQNSKNTNFGLSALTLAAFEDMSGEERLSLLLRGCDENTVVPRLRAHVRPLMGANTKSPAARRWMDLLGDWMLSCTRGSSGKNSLGLRLSAAIVCASAQSLPVSQRIIPHTARQVRVALDVVHATPRSDLVEEMYSILDSMPDLRKHAKKSRAVASLMQEIDAMETHIDACEILRDRLSGADANGDGEDTKRARSYTPSATPPPWSVPMWTFLPGSSQGAGVKPAETDDQDRVTESARVSRTSLEKLELVERLMLSMCNTCARTAGVKREAGCGGGDSPLTRPEMWNGSVAHHI